MRSLCGFLPALLVCCLLTTAFSGCRQLYVANNQNVPMFRDTGELRANIGANNWQIAYAPFKRVGVMLNGQWNEGLWTGNALTDSVNGGFGEFNEIERLLIEGGAGIWQPLPGNGSFETYAGFGVGTIDVRSNNWVLNGTPPRFSANISRWFVQPSISTTADYWDLGFSTRLSGVRYGNVDTVGVTPSILEAESLANIDAKNHLFLEPAVTARFGYRWVKLHGQLGFVAPLSRAPISYRQILFTIGINVHLAERFEKNAFE